MVVLAEPARSKYMCQLSWAYLVSDHFPTGQERRAVAHTRLAVCWVLNTKT